MRILITGGGCEEAIDGVRSISNFSTGKTAAFLADYFYLKGVDVTLLTGKRAQIPENSLPVLSFSDFHSLEDLLIEQLETSHWDVVIHAAAVSDYSVDYIEMDGERLQPEAIAKLDSDGSVSIKLKKNPKLINSIKAWSKNQDVVLIGFKLTRFDEADVRDSLVAKLFSQAKPDMVVWNPLSGITEHKHNGRVYLSEKQFTSFQTKTGMAQTLWNEIEVKI